MVAAMAGFTLEDVLVKEVSQTLPVGEILVLFGVGGALIFALVARLQGQRLLVGAVLSPPMRIRALFEVTGRLFYVLAIALTPLSSATVILQATPLVVVAGAMLFLGERVGWRRWAAIVLGMIGVIIVIRPGSASFSPLSLLAVLGMIGFAGRDLASRAAPATLSTSILGLYGFLSVVFAGTLFSVWDGEPFVWPHIDIAMVLTSGVVAGVVAYSCLMKAMRTGEVSAVTPFRYTRLLFGVAAGVLFFGEQLSPAILMGSGLVVLSGGFVMWRSGAKN